MLPRQRYPNVLHRFQHTLHLYGGLFISPFVLVFAISAILLNHTWKPGGELPESSVRRQENIEIRTDLESLPLARQIMEQVGISGEIEFFRHEPRQKRLVIPVMRPGQRTRITVDVESRTAQIEQRHTGFWDALLYLHKSPGPHLAGFRGNWFATRIWAWLADATACLLLLISASGVYLWALLKTERRTGLIVLGAGAMSFFALAFALVR
jgi:hypothetical protein